MCIIIWTDLSVQLTTSSASYPLAPLFHAWCPRRHCHLPSCFALAIKVMSVWLFYFLDNTAESRIIVVELYNALWSEKEKVWLAKCNIIIVPYITPTLSIILFPSGRHQKGGALLLHMNWTVRNSHYRMAASWFTFYQSTLIPLWAGLTGKPQLQTINYG